MNELKQVIELIRVSTEAQAGDDRAGIPAQRAVNRRTVQQNGLTIVRSIEMADVSGTAVLNAPEMQQLLQLIELPEIHGVVAKEFSRLMRPENFSDFVLLQKFVDTHTILYLPEGPIDLSSKAGRFMGMIRAAMAGWERREIMERMQDAKEAMRRQGKHPGGSTTLPFGVGYSHDRGWFYTDEAVKVRRAYELILTTKKTYAEIAREVNLPRSSLRLMLQNPIYSGWRTYDEKRDPSSAGYVPGRNGRHGYRRKIDRGPDEVIRLQVFERGLVSEEDFYRVQEILNERTTREWAIRTKNAPHYVFNGFLFCGLCYEPMYCHTNQRAGYYFCKRNGTRARRKNQGCRNPYILSGKIEPKIEELFSKRLQEESILEGIAEAYLAEEETPRHCAVDDERRSAERQLQAVQAKRSRVLEAFIEGLIDKSTRDEKLAVIDADLAAYSSVLTGPELPAIKINLEELANILSVFTGISFLCREDKRALLAEMGARVLLHGYEIKAVRLLVPSTYSDSHLPMADSVGILPFLNRREISIPINW